MNIEKEKRILEGKEVEKFSDDIEAYEHLVVKDSSAEIVEEIQ